MEFYLCYFFCCVGAAVTVVTLGYGLGRLFDRYVLKGWRPRKHWKMDRKTYEWLGRWGA